MAANSNKMLKAHNEKTHILSNASFSSDFHKHMLVFSRYLTAKESDCTNKWRKRMYQQAYIIAGLSRKLVNILINYCIIITSWQMKWILSDWKCCKWFKHTILNTE